MVRSNSRISSSPNCMIIFLLMLISPTVFINTNYSVVSAYINKNGGTRKSKSVLSVPQMQHKVNGTVGKAARHMKIRGASDFIIIRNLSDGALDCSPLSVHFGSGIFAEKGQNSPTEGLRVAMAVNGKRIEGMALKTDRNGIVEQRRVNLKPLMNLLRKKGRYSVQFSVQNWEGRTVGVDCFLYFWDNTSKLVISDIDGTVTKSDLWGMILGKAWLQPGIRTLYGRIKRRGYKIVYLSARPASVGTLTRNFLARLRMPSGPLLLSPEPLGKALKTAVKDPQRIKIICMKRLKDLYNFPRGNGRNFDRKRSKVRRKMRNPFFAAFGNQPSDKLAYEMLSVPNVFMVNFKGAVTVYKKGGQSADKGKSYRYISDHMHNFFPRLV